MRRTSGFGEMLRFHRFLISDTASRLDLFNEAIRRRLRPGDVVLDLGAGSGILGLFACQAGARHVYSVERGVVVELARSIAAANGFADRLTFFRGVPQDFTPPEPIDVIVMDLFNTSGLQSGALSALIDIRRRALKPRGVTIPGSLTLLGAPVEVPAVYSEVADFWATALHGLDLSPVRAFSVNYHHAVRIEPSRPLADAAVIWTTDLTTVDSTALSGAASFNVRRPGTIHGIGAWFAANLSGDLTLTNQPGASNTNYAQAFFPLAQPVLVQSGDRIAVQMSTFDSAEWRWCVTIDRAGGTTVRFDQSTLPATLLEGRGSSR